MRIVIRDPSHDRKRSLGFLACWWIDQFCVHGPGDVEGEKVQLDDELCEFIVDCYTLDRNGRRLYDSAFFSRAKGRAKSELAGFLVLFEALGPCRFERWAKGGETYEHRGEVYTYEPGEPIGRRVVSPFIRCLATEEGQAGNTYDNVYFNLSEGMLGEGWPPDAAGLTRTYIPGGGEIRPSTSGNASKDGGKETFSVFDEALALDTPVPTPTGWTTIGAIEAGNHVIGADGNPVEVVKATPVQYGRMCYRVWFEDGTWIVASDGHLWATKVCGSAAKPKVRTTGEMFRDGRRFRVPVHMPWTVPAADLPIDPYVLGAWLGDGDSTNATIFGEVDDLAEIVMEIEHRGYTTKALDVPEGKCPGVYVSVPGSHRNRFSPVSGLKVMLRDLGLLGNKRLPAAYLRGSIDQRTDLLRGLMDTDGSVDPGGHCTFTNANERVADGVIEILRSLGEVPVKRWGADERGRNGGCWYVTFTPRAVNPFVLSRKRDGVKWHRRGPGWVTVKAIEAVPSVPVRCIAVDAEDHLFLAGHGAHVTHNTHLYVLPELVRMYATVRRNAAKRKAAGPWTLETSTMYQKGEGSVAEKTHDFAEKIASGKVRTTRLLFDHREAPPDVDLENEEELYEALREVYGPFADVMDLSRIVDEIWDPRNSEQDSRRYFLNQSTDATDAWIEANEWAAIADPTKIIADKEMIVIGFDGSRRRSRGVTDATALIGCRVSDGHLFELGVWEQPDGPAGDDWQVPTDEVDFEVQHAFRRFKVVGMYCDPAKWETWIAKWEAEWSKQLLAKATQQHPMEWWVTGGRSTFIVRALTEFHDAIVEKELSHSGEYTLTRHVLNARRRPSKSGIQIAKENPESPKKIDAAFAAVLAWQARTDAIAAGALLKKDAEKFVPRRIR